MKFDEESLASLRFRLSDYLTNCGVSLKTKGNRLVASCPVHDDRNPSFSVFGKRHEMAGCFPCGFTGDIFATSQWLGRSSSFVESVQDVAATVGVHLPGVSEGGRVKVHATRPRPAEKVGQESTKATGIKWPAKLFKDNGDILREFCVSRAIDHSTGWILQEAGIVRFCGIRGDLCFTVTDSSLIAAEIRKVDRSCFFDDRKAYPLAGVDKSWLPGMDMLRKAPPDTGVILTEGATDLITAFHLYAQYSRSRSGNDLSWQPATLLGAACKNLHPDCAEMLRGRRVRIVPDADAAGEMMAHFWADKLTSLKCSVEIVQIPAGKDLTDIAPTLNPKDLFQ